MHGLTLVLQQQQQQHGSSSSGQMQQCQRIRQATQQLPLTLHS
jgi:hypothetical protein